LLRARVVRVAGHPADFGAPAPDPDILVAGHSLCQDYLAQVRAGDITCRPAIAAVEGRQVEFVDGRRDSVDAIVCATGYRLDIPYLPAEVWSVVGPDLRQHHRTLHPELPGFGVIGQFALQGPYLPLLELQARWIVGLWSGEIAPPPEPVMRSSAVAAPPVLEPHNVLAVTLADAAGVGPDLRARAEWAEPLLFGPMLPPRYRLDGPGARPDAEARFLAQLSASPRAAVEPDDVAALPELGLGDLLPFVTSPPRPAVAVSGSVAG
jgi:hypothetical protein